MFVSREKRERLGAEAVDVLNEIEVAVEGKRCLRIHAGDAERMMEELGNGNISAAVSHLAAGIRNA